MSVISRPDGQVEKILIEPIGQRRPADEATSAAHADDEDPPRRATATTTATPATTDADRADHARPPLEDEQAGRADPLPVWLL